jgi:hypothetical protein
MKGKEKIVRNKIKEDVMITLLGWCKDPKKKYSHAKLTWKDRKFFNDAIEKKLINSKHKVRLKIILFKEEGFLENKLKKWKNHCKEKENVIKKLSKRKDKTKSNMMRTRIKLSEKIFLKPMFSSSEHNYLKRNHNSNSNYNISIIQLRLRNAFRLENFRFGRFTEKEQKTSIIKLFNEIKLRVNRSSLDNFPKWCICFNAKLLIIEIWKNGYLSNSGKFDLRRTRNDWNNQNCEESNLEISKNGKLIEGENTSINVSLSNRKLRYYRQLNSEYPEWCNHKNEEFANQSNNFGKINFDRKNFTELQVYDYRKMKKTKRKIEYLSNELCKLKKSIEEIKFRNEP